jgi:pimeloyl-ACP methyl ester carboxylesterase
MLTPQEKSAGWRLLFDGKTTNGWIDPAKKTPPGDAWTIEDGCLKAQRKPRITEDLVSADKFRDFELVWDWRISPGGNSGVKYRIQDFVWIHKEREEQKFEEQAAYSMRNRQTARPEKGQNYVIGFEYQMIDDERHADAQISTHTTGALYDMMAPSSRAARPIGEFNHSRLVARGNHVEHWLNGVKVVDALVDSKARLEGMSKRWGADSPVYELLAKQPQKDCPISLQNHGAEAWFRNIKIRLLPAPVEGTVKSEDGLPIVYDSRGAGDTALVFVHCWTCDRSFWREQLDAFASDYRVVSLDLGGHGASGKDRKTWTIAGLGGDVQAVVDKLGLKRVTLVGHSMGGPVALEAARRLSGRVIGIIAIDTLQDAENVPPKEVVQQMAAALTSNFEGMMDMALGSMFQPDGDPTVKAWVAAKAKAVNRPAAIGLMEDFPNLDFKKMFAAARVPIRAVNAAPYPPSNVKTNIEGNRKYADFDAVIIEGAGHFLLLERPEEVNAQIRAFAQALSKK